MSSDSKEGDWRIGLERFRDGIDRIDDQIVDLLVRRQEIAVEIGRIKISRGLDILDPAREEGILRRLEPSGGKVLAPESIRCIFSEVISAARSVQAPLTVAYLGPEGTFSHGAAMSLFGHSATLRSAESIEEVFKRVEKGVCNKGVVPVENSYEGSVGGTLDLLSRYDLKIQAETFVRIRHHLLSQVDSISEIKRLYSHPMAIAQCRPWLTEHLPGVDTIEVESTSLAAQLAAKEAGAAAVGGRPACRHYLLKILAEDIEDNPRNVTRFLVMGKTDVRPTGKDKTSFLFSVKHEPGSLYRVMGPLNKNRLNMTRIESRPMKTRNWEYHFFVDIEGHVEEKRVKEAFGEMEAHCAFFKLLGSYPAGGDPWD